jgi:hypothetical protein
MESMPDPERRARREKALRDHGAAGPVIEELLAYGATPFERAALEGLSLPLADERHLEVWEEYEGAARRQGVLPALAERLVQLRFPIQAGISQTDAYRAATRRGSPSAVDQPGLALRQPDGLELTLHATAGGRVPVLVAGARQDFVALVQALASRNEPEAVPDAMGACIVNGLNNWDRVARHRREFEATRGVSDEDAWAEEFRRMAADKALYQDRLILLSRGPYSAVRATEVGLDEAEWLARSLVIRREHECTHYFTLRVFGIMRNHLLDELIADFIGLTAAFGRYDARLALRFFGLEDYPRYRPGGRLESYLGQPPLSPEAVRVVHALVVKAAQNLERLAGHEAPQNAQARAHWISRLTGAALEELASADEIESRADPLPA